MPYDYLVIHIRPKTYSESVPPRFNRWLNEWLIDFLIEDYDELEFGYINSGYSLTIPTDNILPDIADTFERSICREWKKILFSSVHIHEDEYKIYDCYMV